ncbi:MAG: hypothetical protein LIP01_03745 [Tannerellaceae bacterium]|nr:hypothetical protein [Tannerellaceae bacterium]
MTDKEKIVSLLQEVKRLEELLNGVRNAEIYPVSFFNESFELTRSLLHDLCQLEKEQVETLHAQMELRQAMLQETPPVTEEVIPESTNTEIIEEQKPEEKTIEELLREYAPAPQPLIPEKNTTSLSDIMEKKQLADFRKAFSLNDRFYFLRELFAGDDIRMNEVIADLNEIQSLEDSLDYINNKMRWNPEDKPVADFILLLEKRFL